MGSVLEVQWVAVLIRNSYNPPNQWMESIPRDITRGDDQQPGVLCPDWVQRVGLRVEPSAATTGGP